jgi:hypothetical protein
MKALAKSNSISPVSRQKDNNTASISIAKAQWNQQSNKTVICN